MIEDDYDDQVIMTLYYDHMTVTAHDEQCSFVLKSACSIQSQSTIVHLFSEQ